MKKWLILYAAAAVVLLCAVFILTRPQGPSASDVRRLRDALAQADGNQAAQDAFRVDFDVTDLSVAEGLSPGWTHILLLGTDERGEELNTGRTDAMIVASFSKASGKILLTSLARDWLVNMPGNMGEHKLNAAHAFGGPLYAVKAVNELLGLNITRYLSVNFRGFNRAIEALGGVRVSLSEAEAKRVRVGETEGTYTLNGSQALQFARIRALDNSFGRDGRQRRVLSALKEQAEKLSVAQVMGLLSQVLGMTAANITFDDVTALLPVVLDKDIGVKAISLPSEGFFHYTLTNDGESAVAANPRRMRNAFQAFLSGGEIAPE